jgi:hypothetical protein
LERASFALAANKVAQEMVGRPPGGGGGARSNMTQGAKIKEIVQIGGWETAS